MLPADESPHPIQIDALRRLSPGQRLNLAQRLYWQARRLVTAGVRDRHPDWTEELIDHEVTRRFWHGPEYVIVRKLEFLREGGSQKHARDIRGMLAVSGEDIDRALLARLIDERRLQAPWDEVTGGR